MPAPCSGSGSSPRAMAAITGTAGAVAATGATMVIVPTARPRYSAATPTASARPASTAYSTNSPAGGPSPEAATITASISRAAPCETSSTDSSGVERLFSPPRKSETP